MLIDGQPVGSLARVSYLLLTVQRGQHTLIAKNPEDAPRYTFQADAGSPYFFEIGGRPGFKTVGPNHKAGPGRGWRAQRPRQQAGGSYDRREMKKPAEAGSRSLHTRSATL